VTGDPAPPTAAEVPLGDGRVLETTVHGAAATAGSAGVAATAGSGPTVVFEAGMGAGQGSWALVAPEVARRTRVVTYNRAGIGRSTVDPEPRTVARAAADLVALLADLDPGPAVLVAHSYGGPVVREALATAPERVAGLVLVDQTDEDCDLFFARGDGAQRAFAKVLPTLARVGLLRLVTGAVARSLPPDARRAVVVESGSVAGARAHARELAGFDADLRRLRDDPHPTPDVPVTLISGTRPPRGRSAARRRACLVDAHRRGAAGAPQGRHVAAARSGHMVPLTEPQLVVDEVLRLVDGVRTPPAAP
jgi:pimeloyl-ACP methyl ester carboxylesterase